MELLGVLLACVRLLPIAISSPGVLVDGVDGGVLEGPTVFTVPELFAAPEEVGFLFLAFLPHQDDFGTKISSKKEVGLLWKFTEELFYNNNN